MGSFIFIYLSLYNEETTKKMKEKLDGICIFVWRRMTGLFCILYSTLKQMTGSSRGQ